MTQKPRVVSTLGAALFVIAVSSSFGRAQQPGSVAVVVPDSASSQSGRSSEPPDAEPSGTEPSDPNPDPLAAPLLRRAGFLSPTLGLWHVGPLWLTSADLYETYAVFDRAPTATTVGNVPSNIALSSLTVSTAYIKRLSPNANITLQYQPRLSILNGHTRANLLDQNAAFNTAFRPTPRLSVSVSDTFQSYSDLNLNGNNLFYGDPRSGTTVQNIFLHSKAHTYTDTAGMNFAYDLSAKTHLSISPNVTYTTIRGTDQTAVDFANGGTGVSQITTNLSELSYGTNLGLSRSLTPSQTLGVFYSYEQTHISATHLAGAYNTVGVTYSQRFRNQFQVSGHLGASTYSVSTGRAWTPEVALSATKGFRFSSLSLAYYRSQGFGGYVTTAFNDRADLQYGRTLGRKFGLSTGLGYFRTQDSITSSNRQNPSIWGKYASAQLSYAISSHFRYFVSYTQFRQKGDGFQISSGTDHLASTGIQWLPSQSNRGQH